jgi:hypothetical protein
MSTADSYKASGDTCCLHSRGSLRTVSGLSIDAKNAGFELLTAVMIHSQIFRGYTEYGGRNLLRNATRLYPRRLEGLLTPLRKPQISQVPFTSIFFFLSFSLFLTSSLRSGRPTSYPGS